MDDETMRQALMGARTIAVVGLSDKPTRASHSVARFLQGQGYRIIPVNPNIREALGEVADLRLFGIFVAGVFRGLCAARWLAETTPSAWGSCLRVV